MSHTREIKKLNHTEKEEPRALAKEIIHTVMNSALKQIEKITSTEAKQEKTSATDLSKKSVDIKKVEVISFDFDGCLFPGSKYAHHKPSQIINKCILR